MRATTLSKAISHALPVLIAVCSAGRSHVATAPCFFQVSLPEGSSADASNLRIELQVTPAGEFRPRDARPMPPGGVWRIDAAIAARVIARFRANKTPLVLDYEHQTILSQENGQPAPAAGRFVDLQWRDGQGLFATVELTSRARQYIADGEYLYFSPVFGYDAKTGDVLELLMGALTNNPALDGMAPLALRAAARFTLTTDTEEPTMNKLLALCVAQALVAATASEDDAVAALKARLEQADPLVQLRKDLGLGAEVGVAEISTAVAALKTKVASAGEPDPTEYVPRSMFDELNTRVAALSTQQTTGEVEQLVSAALSDGRLLAGQADWARKLGQKNIADLKAYLVTAAPIAALRGSQTDGIDPTADTAAGDGLTREERAVCAATGVSAKDFLAAKKG